MQTIGSQAESKALAFLKTQGLKLLERNFRCKLGEIDLIMQDKDFTVFVEVKYRKIINFGEPVETVTKSKQRKIIKAATFYLQQKDLFDKVPCRFDVVGILDDGQINWIKDAFIMG
ncbi:MAG: YraN family protein [Gammaproteobacteria bacterium RIFOXYB2_FULL_38_6]|nr:MAG: YraN family protein [Gammaproteobacteria bacterium RIFOXYB2_FULL_38_6]